MFNPIFYKKEQCLKENAFEKYIQLVNNSMVKTKCQQHVDFNIFWLEIKRINGLVVFNVHMFWYLGVTYVYS